MFTEEPAKQLYPFSFCCHINAQVQQGKDCKHFLLSLSSLQCGTQSCSWNCWLSLPHPPAGWGERLGCLTARGAHSWGCKKYQWYLEGCWYPACSCLFTLQNLVRSFNARTMSPLQTTIWMSLSCTNEMFGFVMFASRAFFLFPSL